MHAPVKVRLYVVDCAELTASMHRPARSIHMKAFMLCDGLGFDSTHGTVCRDRQTSTLLSCSSN